MKSLLGKLGVILIGFIILGYGCIKVNTASAQNTLALQEKCAEGAEKLDRDKCPPYPLRSSCISFEYHYNKKFDRCFARIGYWFGQAKGKDGLNHNYYKVGLYDVFENSKPIGEVDFLGLGFDDVLRCYVGNKRCKSSDEFEALIKPYMEE